MKGTHGDAPLSGSFQSFRPPIASERGCPARTHVVGTLDHCRQRRPLPRTGSWSRRAVRRYRARRHRRGNPRSGAPTSLRRAHLAARHSPSQLKTKRRPLGRGRRSARSGGGCPTLAANRLAGTLFAGKTVLPSGPRVQLDGSARAKGQEAGPVTWPRAMS